ncbi:50S ribosomal protein L24 [Candidatus Gottesmanbacteria bacterium RBG_16_43_7]|uniref:Large ribosomal subunit protein uL24 n=1 Tax=Candidatus Gottesmanbacteria bacterium RBG_16_43_7 TaxID=1798373 RepID=A0A1F5ZAI5_9BACT|nr:MAG: 50S ribosomal protein L24 [Candidatus Gottesmanbacteria bacterium RBG_16_43_7]
MKLKIGDTVFITAGKDKGRKGKIEKIYPKMQTVLIPGVNMYKRHAKRRDDKNPGGIIDFSRPLPVGNVVLICPKCNQKTRIGYQSSKGDKIRTCKKCEQQV